MEADFPQLAFNQWLTRRLQTLISALTPESAEEAYLGRAVDLADLERRQRALRYDRPASIHY
jgi:phage portal protein BeeE